MNSASISDGKKLFGRHHFCNISGFVICWFIFLLSKQNGSDVTFRYLQLQTSVEAENSKLCNNNSKYQICCRCKSLRMKEQKVLFRFVNT